MENQIQFTITNGDNIQSYEFTIANHCDSNCQCAEDDIKCWQYELAEQISINDFINSDHHSVDCEDSELRDLQMDEQEQENQRAIRKHVNNCEDCSRQYDIWPDSSSFHSKWRISCSDEIQDYYNSLKSKNNISK